MDSSPSMAVLSQSIGGLYPKAEWGRKGLYLPPFDEFEAGYTSLCVGCELASIQ